jgi:hypothetical protein
MAGLTRAAICCCGDAKPVTGWATPEQVAAYVHRPVRTIRNWAAQGLIPSACDAETGRLIVHAASARQHAETRPMRNRLLTRVS